MRRINSKEKTYIKPKEKFQRKINTYKYWLNCLFII
jgi:hypothetical protein